MAKQRNTFEEKEEIAKRVSQHVQLTDIRLVGSLAFNHIKPGEELPIHAGQKIDVQAVPITDKTSGGFAARAQFGISIGYESDHEYVEGETDVPLMIDGAFLLVYSVQDQVLLQKEIEAFVSVTSLRHAWPYWREFVQSMTTRMGLPGMTIPLIKQSSSSDAKSSPVKKTAKPKRKASPKK